MRDLKLMILAGAALESDSGVRKAYFEFYQQEFIDSTDAFLFVIGQNIERETNEELRRQKEDLIRWFTLQMCGDAGKEVTMDDLLTLIGSRRKSLRADGDQ